MLDDDARMAALSAVVLQLHRGCRAWPAAMFQDRAFELLGDVLPFDSALWGAENASTHSLVALHACRMPEGVWALQLAPGLVDDPLLAAARAATGTAVTLAGAPPATGLAQGMAMAQLEPLSKLRSFVCLWRAADAQHFSPSEQRMLQFVVPHLLETARESQLARGPATADATPARSHAVCDLQGALQHVDDRCQALLRLEWPQWPGGVLPAPLLAALNPSRTPQHPTPPADTPPASTAEKQAEKPAEGPTFVGRRIAVRMAISGRSVLLAVRLRAPCDKLSARQRSIADLYASGCTGPEIAQRLGLAASTVNNHLGDVFKKLQVSSKLQLVRALKGADA